MENNSVINNKNKFMHSYRLKTLKNDFIRYKMHYLFLLPALITVAIFAYRPMVGVLMAFQDYSATEGILGSPFVGLKHFYEFLQTPDFYKAFKNTIGINILMICIGFPIPIIFALMINEIRNKHFKKICQTISYLPHFISWVVIAGMVYRMLDIESGSINLLIKLFGGEPVAFLREAKYFWPILISTSIWKELGWDSIIFLAAISSIDSRLYEAAIVDGAGRLRQIISITLPGISTTIGLLLIFRVGTLVNASGGASFDAIFNLQNPLVMDSSMVLDIYVYIEGIQWLRTSYATAIGLTQSIVSFLLVVIANKISKRLTGYGAF